MTKEQRHRCMAAIHSKDTKPEMLVRKLAGSSGYRASQVSHGDIRERVFLAWTRWV